MIVKKNKIKHIVYFIKLVYGVMSYDLEDDDSGFLPTRKFVTTYPICCKGGRLYESI